MRDPCDAFEKFHPVCMFESGFLARLLVGKLVEVLGLEEGYDVCSDCELDILTMVRGFALGYYECSQWRKMESSMSEKVKWVD